MHQQFLDYTLDSVYGEVDDRLSEEIVAFWTRNGAIADAEEARRRTREVVFVIRNQAGIVVGISSVFAEKIVDGRPYYFLRMFIQKPDRVFNLMRAVARATYDFFQTLPVADKPAGMMIVTENAKLMRPGIRQRFMDAGGILAGKTPEGFDVWKWDFPEKSLPDEAGDASHPGDSK